jgi:type I restriction enzyme S subunit
MTPAAVPHPRLGEVGEFRRGRRFTKADRVPVGTPSIHYGEIYTHYGISATEVISHVNAELAPALRFAEPGDVVFAAVGETVEDVGKAVAWLGQSPVAVHDDCFIFRSALDPKYVSYFSRSIAFNAPKEPLVARAKVKRLSGEALASLRIPVPTIEVQREIVKVLDEFTALEAELEAALEAELEARALQNSHYRKHLISNVGAQTVSLASLGRWIGGMTPSKAVPRFWESGTIPWLASMDVSESNGGGIRGRVTQAALDETSLKVVAGPSVAVVMRSNILRRRLPISLVANDTTVNQDVRLLAPRNDVDADYVYHALRAMSEEIRRACVRTDGSMAAVDSGDFLAWPIPLPSFGEQRQIAAKLRAFDDLANDLSIGLPAELRARRQQYEYYRDDLLTFPEAAA